MTGWVITKESRAGSVDLIGSVEAPADSSALLCGWINPFRGWILCPTNPGASGRRVRPQALRVYAGDRRVGSCQCGFNRPDLVGLLTREEAAEAGFSGHVYLPAPSSDPLRIVAVLRDGQTRPFAMWPPGEDSGRPVCFGYLDCRGSAFPGDPGRLEVSGWAFLPGRLTTSVEVWLDGRPALLCDHPLPRPDVGKRFPLEPQAADSGVRAVFEPTHGPSTSAIRVRLTDPAGRSAELH